MANDKWGGYTPKKEEFPTKLDSVNPFEFRKGMDIELTSLGVSRLAESTPEERKKCTETVLKNLEGHGGYYTSLVTYETEYRNLDKKPTFKQWLSEQDEYKMKEVDKTFKNDKMEELKEAIKAEVKAMLLEVKDKEADKINKADAKKAAADEKDSDKAGKKKGSEIKSLEKDIETLKGQKEKNLDKLKKPLEKYKAGKFNSKKYDSAKAEYMDVSKTLVDDNKDIVKQIKEKEKEIEDIQLKEKMDRREVAKSMMERDTHMEILNIMKEAGVNLREGAGGIKMYYEIAKTAYQEGFMAGLKK
tara:strand:+ start:134 stop:1039 length:906 start_codon:yes stop_codon:yes gene_type:complete